ncbi:MAG: RagB/SusD family nutrient uptake outer membrane protein [Longimicrobiales bacterium]
MRDLRMFRRGARAFLTTLFLLTAGCGDIFDIENPGQILDSDLNDPDLISILITGLSSDVSDFIDNQAFNVARLTDEMAGSGSYTATGTFRRGYADQDLSNAPWEQAHEARWMAELHIERIQDLLEPSDFQNSPQVARAYIMEGIAHRSLGESYCRVVYSEPEGTEYGTIQPKSEAFNRAVTAFQNALSHASTSPEFQMAAHAGLASVYLALDDWANAVQEAGQVDDDFELVTYYDYNDDSNIVYVETFQRPEISAFGTLAGGFDPPDPRAPFTKCNETGTCQAEQGADGQTFHWRQEKYPDYGSDIPTLTGKEARLIEAEAALRNGDLAEFTAQINRVRDLYDLPHIAEPASAGALEYPNAYDDAWSILDAERHLTFWLEGRRLWDLHRWDHPFLDGGEVVWPSDPQRDSCLPIPSGECRYNPNFTCEEAMVGTAPGH